jgi:hypothetical protein
MSTIRPSSTFTSTQHPAGQMPQMAGFQEDAGTWIKTRLRLEADGDVLS